MRIPREIYGNPILLVISFSKAAQQQTSDWGKALRADKSEKAQHLNYLQIAELEDVPRLMRGFVRSGIRKGIPSDLQEKFLLLFEGEEQLKRLTKFQKSEDAYVLLLDPTASILAQDSGPVSLSKLASILEKLPPPAKQNKN
jgi:hypothetical protein